MKKFLKFAFVAISVLFLSQTAFADRNTTSCRVYGAEDVVVTVDTPIVEFKGDYWSKDKPLIYASFSLTKKAPENISVSVEVYDSNNTNVGNGTVTFTKGTSTTQDKIILWSGCKKGQMFFVRLSSASCR